MVAAFWVAPSCACQEPSLSLFGMSMALTGMTFTGSKAASAASGDAAASAFSGSDFGLAWAEGASAAILTSPTFNSAADGEIRGAATIVGLGGVIGLEGTGAATGSAATDADAVDAGAGDGGLAATGVDDAASR